jgi:hypothetical protein
LRCQGENEEDKGINYKERRREKERKGGKERN